MYIEQVVCPTVIRILVQYVKKKKGRNEMPRERVAMSNKNFGEGLLLPWHVRYTCIT